MVGTSGLRLIGMAGSILLTGCASTWVPEAESSGPNSSVPRPDPRLVTNRVPRDTSTSQLPAAMDAGVPPSEKCDQDPPPARPAGGGVVKDGAVRCEPMRLIEVSPGDRCPLCFWQVLTAGTRTETRWVCDAQLHGNQEDLKKKAEVMKPDPP